MIRYAKCNLCGAEDFRVLIKDPDSDVVKCKKCGLVYINPMISEEKAITSIASDGNAAEHIREVWQDSKNKLFFSNIKKIDSYIKGRGTLLDLGCGYGIFMKIARDNHWKAVGIELSDSAYRYAREKLGLEVYNKTLKQVNFPDNTFEVVTLWEVLAEMTDPLGELKEIKRVLKKDGLVAFRLHNADFHIFLRRLFNRMGNIDAKLRMSPTVVLPYNFSSDTIRKILEKAGFNNIKIMLSENTPGDPYGTGGVLCPLAVSIMKQFIYYLCLFIYFVSFKKLILTPSMIIFARKV